MLWHAEHAACACCGAPLLTSRCHAARCRPLQAEYAFWMRTEGADAHAVTVDLPSGGTATLNRYVASVEAPRPEAYREDLRTAAAGATPDERRRIYSEIAAATESGWDFSSRWMADRTSLASLHTSDLLPADLNAIMYKFEANLQQLSAMAGDKGAAAAFGAAAARRRAALDELLWSEEKGQWLDVHWPTGARVEAPPSASNWLPLWAGAFDGRQARLATRSLRASGLIQRGGLATTLTRGSDQQWDWPNAWAPLQEMVIEGLERTGRPDARELGLTLGRRWVGSNLRAFRATHFMYEKYSAVEHGVGGGGGEYTPQVGFGWSNGVALSLVARYGDALVGDRAAPRDHGSS